MPTITAVQCRHVHYDLPPGAGSDAVHATPKYGYAVALLETSGDIKGSGITFTLGGGTDLIATVAQRLVEPIIGCDIEELMANFGAVQKEIAEHQQLRWLGPHKGIIHAALGAIVNGCFDLWAKSRGVPLWRLLLDLTDEELVRTLDLSYLEDVLDGDEALKILAEHRLTRGEREPVIQSGYPSYDTSVGWLGYSDEHVRDNVKGALDEGFTAIKLKVGSADVERDVRRTHAIREQVGPEVTIMLDANQAWSLPTAIEACEKLLGMQPFWIEEPTQPDDVFAHQALARALAPVPVAVGECIHNRVVFKNFLQAKAMGIVQADCTRVGGIGEYLAIALLACKYPVRVVPHAGDMGQIHRHLVLFNHIALGHEKLFLESIPHLREHFVNPAKLENGHYLAPEEPGASSDLKL